MLSAGQILNGRYEIVSEIGKGGMSTVYKAKDLIDGKILAVKDVTRNGQGDNLTIVQCLTAEANFLKQLSHPNIPRIYDVFEEPERIIMVMDFVEGENLASLVARTGAQPMDRVLEWGMQICMVFHYLHNQPMPVIYRDMKPANVILQPSGHLMLIDFGTARTQKLGVQMSADTLCLGTSGFAAPEQYGDMGQSNPRTDIFCLGATLYNLITGHSPSDRPVGIQPLEQWNPALKDTPIAQIIYKCTRNDPDARYQTAMELYDDLNRARTGIFETQTGAKSFQRQNLKNGGKTTGALSNSLTGLLQFGKTDKMTAAAPQPEQDTTILTRPEMLPTAAPAEEGPWRRLTMITLVTAVVLLVLSIVLLALQQLVVGLVFVIIALGSAALSVIGVLFARKEQG